tara:strand:+ start:1378 stop:2169 length:792 start_codon:yes stop_codon:yes gene_type:complete
MPRYSLGGGGGTAAVTALNAATESELLTVGSTTTELDAEANLTFASNVLQIGASADIEPRLDLLNDENSVQIGIANGTNDMVAGSADGDLVINSVGDHNVLIAQNDTTELTINDSGVTVAGNLTLAGNAHFDSTPGDNDLSGITATFTAGQSLNRGDVVYFKASDSKLWKADADTAAEMPVVAMAGADISADAAGVFLFQGFLEDNGTFPTYTVGGTLYAPETEGPPTQTAPSTTGDLVQVLGWAITSQLVYFNPSNDVIEHA